MSQILPKMVNELLSAQEQSHYDGFIKSMELLDDAVPTFMVVGADSTALQDAIFEDIKTHISNYKLYENPVNNDDFRPIFIQNAKVPLILRFWMTDADDMLLAAQYLLLFRDEIVRQNNRMIVLVNEALYDTIITKTFDFIAAASYAETFKDHQAQMNADFAPSTEKSWNEKKYDRLLKEWEELQETPDKNLRTQANVALTLGSIAHRMSRLEEALTYYKSAFALTQQLEAIPEQVGALAAIGIICADKGDLNQALEYFKKASEMNKRIKEPRLQTLIDANLGKIYTAKNDTKKALTYFEKSLHTAQKTGDNYGQASNQLNIGELYAEQGNIRKASRSYQQSLKIYKSVSDLLGQAHVMKSIGLLYMQQDNLKDALKYYDTALKYYGSEGYMIGQGSTLNHIGMVYKRNGDFDFALDYLRHARAIYISIGAENHPEALAIKEQIQAIESQSSQNK